MSIALSQKVGAQLVELLGLPKNTVRFDIRFEVNKPVEIRCMHYPDAQVAGVFTELLSSEFTLAPKMRDVTALHDQHQKFAAERP